MNVKEIIDQTVKDARLSRSTSTALAYRNALRIFGEYLASEGISPTSLPQELNIEHFIYYPGWLAERKYKKKTVGVYMSGSRFFLERLIVAGILEPSYGDMLRYKMAWDSYRKKREDSLPRFPKETQVIAILEAVKQMPWESPRRERDIAVIWFLYSSGCRNNEICRLKIKDIDLNERSAIVTGKGSKQRKAYFDSSTAEALRAYWSSRGNAAPEAFAFARHDRGVGKRHQPVTTTTVRNIVHDVCQAAGVNPANFSPHYFRHAFAIRMLRETSNLALVQDLLGHANPSSTRVYAKITNEDLRIAHHSVYG